MQNSQNHPKTLDKHSRPHYNNSKGKCRTRRVPRVIQGEVPTGTNTPSILTNRAYKPHQTSTLKQVQINTIAAIQENTGTNPY